MQQALDLGIIDPTAMTMSTVASDGQPSQRIVLLKNFDDLGFVFYTNYESRKAKELSRNSKVSLLFPWNQIDRQIKICGEAQESSRLRIHAIISFHVLGQSNRGNCIKTKFSYRLACGTNG